MECVNSYHDGKNRVCEFTNIKCLKAENNLEYCKLHKEVKKQTIDIVNHELSRPMQNGMLGKINKSYIKMMRRIKSDRQEYVTRKRIFMDLEFSGLHQKTTPISIGVISQDDETFYAEFNDYDREQCDDFIKKNVIPNLILSENDPIMDDFPHIVRSIGNCKMIADELKEWLNHIGPVQIWGDCLSYDWVIFCQLYGHAFNIPKSVYYIPFDISTLFQMKGIDPDISREEYCGIIDTGIKHNSLYDATVIKCCYEKLMGIKT